MNSIWSDIESKKSPIAIVGLGYVGLPLACLLAKKFQVIGFDINRDRIAELKDGYDRTREVEDKSELANESLFFTADESSLSDSKLIIVAVPTPIDRFRKPDLNPILSASRTVGRAMTHGSVIVFESTVYPGLTENECREVLEQESGLKYLDDFNLGYSPERVNPGDREHTIDKIVKVVSGSTPEVANLLEEVYGSVITAGIHVAPTIATAEAAKVIENTQRDLNIALINELSQIFERVGIDTRDVLAAAGTKWNFLKFRPGLVGGHCIGVDPYYLTYMSEGVGIHPQVILAGRRINDNMPQFVADKTLKLCLADRNKDASSKLSIVIMGVTFKENVPDFRNTKVVDLGNALERFGVNVYYFDPVTHKDEFEKEFDKKLSDWDEIPSCDALIFAVNHKKFSNEYKVDKLSNKLAPRGVVIDVCASLPREEIKSKGYRIWRP